MNKRTTYVIVAALLFFQMASLSRISSLESKIDNMHDTVYTLESQLNNQISSIYQNVDAQLTEQASLVHEAYFEVGTLNAETLSVPITFTVEPKAVTENMNVALDFDGEVIPLEKNGLEYTYTGDFGFTDPIFPTIVFEENGVQTVEEDNGLYVTSLRWEIFPIFYAFFSGQTSYGSLSNYRYRVNGELSIDYKPASKDVYFTSMKYVVKVDGEIMEETPIPLGEEGYLELGLELNNTYPLDKGQTLTTGVVAVDTLGFTHESRIAVYEAGANAQMEPNYGEVTITAPNGERVYIPYEE